MDKNKVIPLNQQLYDIMHPSRFEQNFGSLLSFENYARGFGSSYQLDILIPTYKAVLKKYEVWEGYEQCHILKTVLEELELKHK